MEHCVNCGEEMEDDAEVCRNCGVNQSVSLEGDHGERGEHQKYCPSCGELIHKQAEICPSCGVRQPERAGSSGSSTEQTTAGVLAILLGGIGAHKFYQGRVGLGLVYLCFCWTFIPAIIGLIEGIMMLVADEAEYEEKYADGDILGT